MLLDLLFLQYEAVLVPDEVGCLQVEAMAFHARLEQADDVRVVRVLSEGKTSAIVHEFSELLRLILAKFFNSDLLLLFLDVSVLLLLRSSRKALPWQRTLEEVEEHMSNGFQVISSGLFVANMSVDGSVSGGTCQVLAISEGDVLSV